MTDTSQLWLLLLLISVRSPAMSRILSFAATLLVIPAASVFVADTAAARDSVERLGTWNAKQCEPIPEAIRASFATTDDGKPVKGGSRILISSSSGGCASVERPSGNVIWHARVPNAHSLDLQASEEAWWSDTLGLLNPAGTIQLPGERLYKARWLPQPEAECDAQGGADAKPLFRFVQVNDLHVQAGEPAVTAPGQQTYAKANDKARWVVDAIRSQALGPRPDFVVGVGDLIHGESLDRLAPDLQTLQKIIESLPCPFYPVVGNHEVVQQERSPQYLRPSCAAFGRERMDYTFEHGGILFIALNNSGAPSPPAAAERNQWLGDVLAASRDRPKILLCHIPLIALRDEPTLAKSFGFASYRDHDPGTLQLLEENSDTVIAVLSGHLHLTGMKQQRGIFHISIAGTASYPCDVAAYSVFPDRIEVAVKQLPEDLARAAPSIHGQPRYGQDFTDTEHGSADEYQAGRADERRFTIPWSGKKRPQGKS